MEKRKKNIWITLLSSLMVLIVVGLIVEKNIILSDEEYKPCEEFEAAYNNISINGQDSIEAYDLEETIRILNGMELAQSCSGDFLDYLDYFARQDFSHIPADVIESKKMLFPVLQELYELDEEYKELHIWTNLASKIGSIFCTDANIMYDSKANSTSSLVWRVEEAIDPILSSVANVTHHSRMINTKIFDNFIENQDLKKSNRKQVKKIRAQFIAYLEQYIPVYIKYMKEWDKVCLLKDRAYLSLYNGQSDEALRATDSILKRHPYNREAMLLKSWALLMSGPSRELSVDASSSEAPLIGHSSHVDEARKILSSYMDQYPNRTAPALLLLGVSYLSENNPEKALSYLDQAGIEYPRQAEALKDMLDSYRTRTYLHNSEEGTHLLQLYQSTMEGFGYFSPNLVKAKWYANNGDLTSSAQEVMKHFTRRSSQCTFDCFENDLRFCEQHLYPTIKGLMPENSFVEIDITKAKTMLGLKSKTGEVNVLVRNSTSYDLENVRIFLCIHYTDMLSGGSYVLKCPTINRLSARSSTELSNIPISYCGKGFDQIARVRAIAVTDKSVSWVRVYNVDDNVFYTDEYEEDPALFRINTESYLSSIHKDCSVLIKSIINGTRFSLQKKEVVIVGKTKLVVYIPHEVVYLNPRFDLNGSQRPDVVNVESNYVRLEFVLPKNNSSISLNVRNGYQDFTYSLTVLDDKVLVNN